MTTGGYFVCDGCDPCRVRILEGDPDVFDWPCCESFPDNKAPCRYVWITRCSVSVELDSVNCITGTNRWPLFYAATEFRKHCYVGCEWGMRPTCAAQTGGDDYTAALLDVTLNAINPAFPPSAISGGVLTRHDGDYRSGVGGCLAPNSCYGEFPPCTNTLNDRWTMTAAGTAPGDVTITLTDPTILAWAAANGKATPVYANRNTFEPFGKSNTFDIIAGYSDWPMLAKSGCLGFLDDIGADENPCEDQDSRCACNDFEIGNGVTLLVNITGCDSISGLQLVSLTRYKSPTPLPCGVDYPDPSPCGVFIGTLSTGDGCDAEGVSWSGGVLIMLWCDGDTYRIKVYCYSNDDSCYVEQGEASITRLELLCWGSIYLEFTLPDLDCCCPEEPGLPPCDCAPFTTPPTPLYADIASSCGASFESTSTIELTQGLDLSCWEKSGAGTDGMPSALDIIEVCCSGDEWTCQLTFIPAGCGSPLTVAASGTCDPFSVTFVFDLPASGCCEPSGGTVTVTVME